MELTRAERRRLEKLVGKKPVYYQYTLEQIEEIRQQAIQDKKEEIQKEMNAYVQKKWDSMVAELGGKNEEERMLKVLTLLMSVPARILCEKFHWKPVKDAGDHRSKLLQFSEAVVDKVGKETFEIAVEELNRERHDHWMNQYDDEKKTIKFKKVEEQK